MNPGAHNEQFVAADDGSTHEKRSRIEAIVRDVEEEIAKFSSGSLEPLWRERETMEKYFPSADELEKLPQEDRASLLRLIGRVSAALKLGVSAGSTEWTEAFARENDAVFTHAGTRDELEPMLRKLATLVALHIAAEKNSNMYGNADRRQDELNDALFAVLETKNDARSIEALANPFHFVESEPYYIPTRDKEGNFSLQEKRMGALVVDGKNSVVDYEGKTLRLAEFNRGFIHDRMLLRDGRNYFGGLPEFPKEIADLKPGDHVEFLYQLPLGPEHVFPCEYLGTNAADLEKQYGLAFRPFAKELLMLRVRGKESERAGEEVELPYRDIKAIRSRTH